MVKIINKEGFELNPKKKVRDAIIRAVSRNGGYCPCVQPEGTPKEDTLCPCKNFRENSYCCCNLYTKIK